MKAKNWIMLIVFIICAAILVWLMQINAIGGIVVFAMFAIPISALVAFFSWVKKRCDESKKFNGRK